MAICKYIIITIFLLTYNFEVFADFKKFNNIKITSIDFLLIKIDNFFIKNQHKILKSNPFTVRYQAINYYVIFEKEKNIQITIEAVMDRARYKSKKYYPKHADCNIIRNRIFYNKFGYSVFRRKKNNSLDKELMSEILKNTVYNLTNLDDYLKKFLIKKTNIKIIIIHPNNSKNYVCSGNIVDDELK